MTSQSAERIGGWLLAPLAWLLVALLSASLSLLFFANALMSPQTYTLLRAMSAGHMLSLIHISRPELWHQKQFAKKHVRIVP